MPVGAEFINPNNNRLVLSAEGVGYRYLGQPTLITAGSVDKWHFNTPPLDYWYGDVNPYIYQITLPNGGTPLVGVKVDNVNIVGVKAVFPLGSNVWQIEVTSLAMSGGYTEESYENMVAAAPTVYVFCPYDNSDNTTGAGMQFFNSSGNLTFSTKHKPLWIKQGVEFADASAVYDGSSWNTGGLNLWVYGQAAAVGSYTTPVLLMATADSVYHYGIDPFSQEDIFVGSAGFYLNAGNLYRMRIATQRFTRSLDNDDERSSDWLPWTGLMIEGSGL